MRLELIQTMKGTVDKFNISSQTYYHAVLLFNIIRLKKRQNQFQEYLMVPIKKKTYGSSSDSGSDQGRLSACQHEKQYIKVHHSQMPPMQKLVMTVCLFLVHKLYEPYPLSLSYVLRHLNIDQRYEEYIISLEKEILVDLSYKIQNMLPSNEALFAGQLWDQFADTISSSCIDVTFQINSVLNHQKRQIKISHEIKLDKRQPEFKKINNKKSFDILRRNIETVVHEELIYELYLKKSEKQPHEDLPQMKKVGISLVYVTILQLSGIIFSKRYKFGNELESSNTKQIRKKTRKQSSYLDFVFNDFLQSSFGINLADLKDEVQTIKSILASKERGSESGSGQNNNVGSNRSHINSQPRHLPSFLQNLRDKTVQLCYHHKYHKKNKRDISAISASPTKTDKQIQQDSQVFQLKNKTHSIAGKNSSVFKDKFLESTLYQSNISQRADSFMQSVQCQNKKLQKGTNNSFIDRKAGKTQQRTKHSFKTAVWSNKSFKSKAQQSSTLGKHGNSSSKVVNKKQCPQGYRVSQFLQAEV